MDTNNPVKKRRIYIDVENIKFIIQIIDMHSSGKKWLVEWNDKTRTWETYDVVKDLSIFQNFLGKFCINKKQVLPSYIS